MKRKLLLILSALLVTMTAWADASGSCGYYATYSYVEETHTLTISGEWKMTDFTSGGTPWYSYRTSITTVVIDEGVTTIGNYAFSHFTNLTSITIPSTVESIGQYALYNCSKLTSVHINSGVTSIYRTAFDDCDELVNITVAADNTKFSSENGVLFNKDKTTLVQYPIGKTGAYTIPNSVTIIEEAAFYDCAKLTSVTMPSNLSRVKDYSFQDCTGLTSVVFPSSVTLIGGYAFMNCSRLASVTLNSNPNIVSGAFKNVKSDCVIRMYLAAREGEASEYWTTFYSYYNTFQVDENTHVFKAALEGTSLELTELTTDQIITKNNAVILKSSSSPMVLTLTTSSSSNDFSDNSLMGVSSADGKTANGTHFVLNKGIQGVGFYRMTSGMKIGVGKAYLTYSGALAREFFGFEESTGINTTDCTVYTDENGKWYTLDGRRIQGKPSKQGIYINNGKKVVIK